MKVGSSFWAILSTVAQRIQFYRIAAALLFGALGLQGLWGASEQLTTSDTFGKMLQTAALVAYGFSGVWISVRVLLKKARQRSMEALWGAGVVLATGLAPSVWGGAPLIAGIMSGAAGAAITALTLWLLRAGATSTETFNASHHVN